MRIVLTYKNWVVVELDEPVYYPRGIANYVGFDAEKNLEWFQNEKLISSRLIWRTALAMYPAHFQKADIPQKEFPEKVIQILKISGVLNDDGTANRMYKNFWNWFDSSGGIVKYADTVLKEDMFQAEYPGKILLDVGWYQDRFKIYVISGYDWEHPLAVYECETPAELLNLMRKAKEKIQCIKSSS